MKTIATRPGPIRILAAAFAIAAFAIAAPRAEEPKPVTVVNTPLVNAQQYGPWTVAVQGPVNLAAPPPVQPFQTSASLFIDYPDDTWQSSFTVPAGKLLIIEYVSGQFTKKIGGGTDPSQPPFLFTVTTTSGGATIPHVVPVRGVYDYAGAKSWFQLAEPLRLYAGPGTSVVLKLHHLFSAGYQEEGSISLSGQLQDVP